MEILKAMRRVPVVLITIGCLLLLTACGRKNPAGDTEVHWYVPEYEEPASEELFTQEPYASLLPEILPDAYVMTSSLLLVPSEYGRPYHEPRLRTAWEAKAGTGTMDVDIWLDPKEPERVVEAAGMTEEDLVEPNLWLRGESEIAFNLCVHCTLEGADYYMCYTGYDERMTKEELYRLVMSSPCLQEEP